MWVFGVKRLRPSRWGYQTSNLPELVGKEEMENCGAKVILYLGTLSKVRRMDFVIRVFRKVKDLFPNVTLQLVGGGEDDEDITIIHKEMKSIGLDSNDVLITGMLPMKEAWGYVRRADVCLSPFYPTPILNSTSPTKLIEYMAFAKPVVANDHPEQKKVIEESGSGICVPYDEDRFAEAIVNILNSPGVAVEMGKKGRRYVELNRTYSRLAEMVDKKYQEIIS